MFFFCVFCVQTVYAEPCYLQVKSKSLMKEISSIVTPIISQHAERIHPFPLEGIRSSENHCIYEVAITESGSERVLSISGRKLNTTGETRRSGIKGVQQALLKAIYRAKPNSRTELCNNYPDLLTKECGKSTQSVTGYASISHQCLGTPCAPKTVLRLRAIDVAKLVAMDELAKKLGVNVNSIQSAKRGRMGKNLIKTTSGGTLRGVTFSSPIIRGDEVSIIATANIK